MFFNAVERTEFNKENYNVIINKFKNFDKEIQLKAFLKLNDLIKGTELTQDRFTKLLNIIEMLDRKAQYSAFYNLITTIKGTEILSKCHSFIERKFSNLLNHIENLDEKTRYMVFLKLIDAIKETEIIVRHYSLLLDIIQLLEHDIDKAGILIRLLKVTKEKELTTYFFRIFEILHQFKLGKEHSQIKIEVFMNIMRAIKSTQLVYEHQSFLEQQVIIVLKFYEEIQEKFSTKLAAFSWLIEGINHTPIIKKLYSLLEKHFIELINGEFTIQLNSEQMNNPDYPEKGCARLLVNFFHNYKDTQLLKNNAQLLKDKVFHYIKSPKYLEKVINELERYIS